MDQTKSKEKLNKFLYEEKKKQFKVPKKSVPKMPNFV